MSAGHGRDFFLGRGVKGRGHAGCSRHGFPAGTIRCVTSNIRAAKGGRRVGPAGGNHDSGLELRGWWSESHADYNDGMGADKPAFSLILEGCPSSLGDGLSHVDQLLVARKTVAR